MVDSDARVDPQLREAFAPRFRVIEQIGAGGMARIYSAEDVSHRRVVAVKVMEMELAATVGAERFLREIRFEAGLQHPLIVPIYESGEVGGFLYYVMPRVEGESLRDVLKRERQLSFERAEAIARDVAQALAHAHDHNIVHRDIKPGNILLSGDRALVADFGVARAIVEAGSEHLTQSGIAVGTPAYMSPEQAGGESQVDGRADLYSLGCVVFEMLAGEPPFTGRTTQAVLSRHLLEEAPSVTVVRPHSPPNLAYVIRRSLEKVPAERFDDATGFLNALDGDVAPDVARTYRPRRRTGKRIAVAVVAAGVLGVAGLGYLSRTPDIELDPREIVVYPLVEQGVRSSEEPAGAEAALGAAIAIQHTPPLRVQDGWALFDGGLRDSPGLFVSGRGRQMAIAAGAGFFVSGTLRHRPDSLFVIMTLHDVRGDSVVAQATAGAEAGAEPASRLGLRAMASLLAERPDGEIHLLETLFAARPSAFAQLVDGELAYRSSRFSEAMGYFADAFRADSSLVFAAAKAAQVANWEHDAAGALRFAEAALALDSLLPPRYADLTRGLAAYGRGAAAEAVEHLESALAVDREFAEAHMALGEVYYHLIPRPTDLAALARVQFGLARQADQSFSPPLVHLSEMAIREGRLARADSLIELFAAFEPQAEHLIRLRAMEQCVAVRPAAVDWTNLLVSGLMFAPAGAQLACAEAALRASMEAGADPSAGRSSDVAWGATYAMQALLIAEGRFTEAEAIVDSSVAAGNSGDLPLLVIGALAGAPWEQRAAETIGRGEAVFEGTWESTPTVFLWLHGSWYGHAGDLDRLAAVRSAVERQTEGGDPYAAWVLELLRAREAVLHADTTSAIGILSAAVPFGAYQHLIWDWESALTTEWILLAHLLEATGDCERALEVASVFDHPTPVMYLEFLPLSLAVRYRCALDTGRRELAAQFRERLLSLGRADLAEAHTNPTGGGT